jgi:hypothetical protein
MFAAVAALFVLEEEPDEPDEDAGALADRVAPEAPVAAPLRLDELPDPRAPDGDPEEPREPPDPRLKATGAAETPAGAVEEGSLAVVVDGALLAAGVDPLPLELVEPASACASFASAELRFACAEARLRFASVGSRSASSWPAATCWPTWTYTSLSVPLVAKLTLSSVAAWIVPLPDTLDWTTPRATV